MRSGEVPVRGRRLNPSVPVDLERALLAVRVGNNVHVCMGRSQAEDQQPIVGLGMRTTFQGGHGPDSLPTPIWLPTEVTVPRLASVCSAR